MPKSMMKMEAHLLTLGGATIFMIYIAMMRMMLTYSLHQIPQTDIAILSQLD